MKFDLPRGNGIRKGNLKNYLSCFTEIPIVLLVGETAGPWGCRFSVIPFTGERLLVNNILPFKGQQSSTHDPPYSEISGTIFWKTLLTYYPKFFVWNTVPFHPHKRGQMFSIRHPTKDEIYIQSKILSKIISFISPVYIIALGKTAEHALNLTGSEPIYVRHPSQSGVGEFRKGIEKIFKSI